MGKIVYYQKPYKTPPQKLVIKSMFLKKKFLTPQGTLVHSVKKKNFLSSLKKPSFEHSQIQLVQITDYRKTESKNSNSMHYKHIRQQLTTC